MYSDYARTSGAKIVRRSSSSHVAHRRQHTVELLLHLRPRPAGSGWVRWVAVRGHKELVRRLVEEGVNVRGTDVLDEVADGEFAELARRWIRPFRGAFPDFRMEIVDLVEEGDIVVGHFRCSGTHLGEWLGLPPTGQRFEAVDEIYVFRVRDGKLVAATGVEDNLTRLRQLGIELVASGSRAGEGSTSAPPPPRS